MTAATWFFDLDGTLTDPKIGITRCIQSAMERLGETPPETEALTWSIGPPLLGTFAKLVGEARAARALEYYRERFVECGWSENQPYPGIDEALQQLCDSGAELYVATSKPRVFAERIVAHFGLGPYFLRVFGSELDGTHGDKSELLAYALAEVAVSGQATMIGDRSFDIVAGRTNGLRALGVTWGYGPVEELTVAGADALLSAPAEIPRA